MDPLAQLAAETAETTVRREVEIDAAPGEVWDHLATAAGRDRWLEHAPDREIHVETADEPSRLVWWWWHGDEPATRVEFVVSPVPAGTRVVVTETLPACSPTAAARSVAAASSLTAVPLVALARALALVAA